MTHPWPDTCEDACGADAIFLFAKTAPAPFATGVCRPCMVKRVEELKRWNAKHGSPTNSSPIMMPRNEASERLYREIKEATCVAG